jgi:hypothetical protein
MREMIVQNGFGVVPSVSDGCPVGSAGRRGKQMGLMGPMGGKIRMSDCR